MERWAEYRDDVSWTRRLAGLVVLASVVAGGYWILFARDGSDDRSLLAREIDGIVEAAMAEGPISGVSVVVARGSRVVHEAGYGLADLENQVAATPETVYRVGSITKQFTAAAVVQQAQEGRIDLSAPAGRYLTEALPDDAHRFNDVTVEQLLNHTSGIKDYTIVEEWWGTLSLEVTPGTLVDVFKDAPRDFAPGSRFSYSNSGYVLLGLILEQVGGRPYGGLLNAEFFVPLQLRSTAYCDDRRVVPRRALGYQVFGEGFRHPRFVSMSQAFSAGAICTSATDLVRWTRMLSRGRVVGRDGYEMMRTRGTLSDGTQIEYGFGIAVSYLEGHHRVGHVGGILGFTGQLAHYDEDDVTIVVLTNTEGANAANIEAEIARVVLGLGDQEIRDIALSSEELATYTGRYDLGPTVISVGVLDGRLEADVTAPGIEGRYVMLYQGSETFVAETDPQIAVTFDVDERGVARTFALEHKGITLYGRRVRDEGDSSR